MNRKQKTNILFFVLFYLGQSIFADSLYDASQKEREGKIDDAIKLYKTWLGENTEDIRFTEILIYCSSLVSSVDETLQLLLEYENFVVNEKKQVIYIRIAKTYQLIFQNYKAAEYYKKASRNADGSLNNEYYLKYLSISYQLGEIPSMETVDTILLSNNDVLTYVKALILKAELLKYAGDYNRAISILHQSEYRNSHPEILYALWEIHLLDNNFSAADDIKNTLKQNFPHSIELGLIEENVDKMVRLSDFFIQAEESIENKSYIQVGSFSNSENIEIMADRLKEYNYDFFFLKANNITKIIVVDIINENLLLSKLKENGFDGFKIDYPELPE